MIRRLAWFLVAEVAFANVLNAMWLLARWLLADRVYSHCDPDAMLAALGGSEDY